MRIGFFGCGNMGQALASGFKNSLDHKVEQYFYTPSKIKAQELAAKVDGYYIENLSEMPVDLDWYVLAFKPQSLIDFNFHFKANSRILSVLAGTSIETLEKKFKTSNVSRLMPNTPSQLGEGANLFYSSFDAREMPKLLESLGKIFIMSSEKEFDAITAFSGAGPALIFEFARIFEKHLISMSAGNPQSKEIIAQTFLGSAKLLEKTITSGESFESLREKVTSKKGVTSEALQILEKNNLDNILGGAFNAAHKRTLELRKGI